MGTVTIQLGQCGNQLGCSLFQHLANEFSSADYGSPAVHEYFRPLAATRNGKPQYVARSVLIDMEPKVVNATRANATALNSWWSYSPLNCLCQQSGSGNNWAQGFHGYGPQVKDGALDLVRREAEACDRMGEFVLLQSMAGGTGAGFGTYIAQALRDEYASSFMFNACVWPYESGEVIVQPYNTLLTLSHLADLADGVVLMENEALHHVCSRLYNISRPSFTDMNGVAARALASVILPSYHRPAATGNTTAHSPPPGGGHGHGGSAGKGRGGVQVPGGGVGGGHESSMASGVNDVSARLANLNMRTPTGPRTAPHTPQGPHATSPSPAGTHGPPVQLLGDVVNHLCGHPSYRLLSLRSIPQMPPSSVEFTTFTWPGTLKRMRQMLITGSILEEGMDWHVGASSASVRSPSLPTAQSAQHPHSRASVAASNATGSSGMTGVGHASSPSIPGRGTGNGTGGRLNKSLASWLVLRGQGAGDVDVSEFTDPAMYAHWSVDPCMVSSHTHKHAKCALSAAMLSNDQHCVGPISRMLEKAYGMLAARAYIHQYETYGLGTTEFQHCFAHVEELLARYSAL